MLLMARGPADLLPRPAAYYPWGIVMENVLPSPGGLDTNTRQPGGLLVPTPPGAGLNTDTPPAGTGGVGYHQTLIRRG